MNRATDREHLLAEVLAETEQAEFRELLLGETLRLAGRRRRARRFRHATATIAVLGLLGAFAWRFIKIRPLIVTPPMANYSSVQTEPLSASAIISTHPLEAGSLITSIVTAGVVHTTPNSGRFRYIDDDELLALLAPRPVVLVRLGPNSEKLVFANPSDQKNFPLN